MGWEGSTFAVTVLLEQILLPTSFPGSGAGAAERLPGIRPPSFEASTSFW